MRRLGRIVEAFSQISGHVSAVIVVVMVLLILYEVFMRFVMRNPPGFAEEMAGYTLVGISFLGLAYTWKEKGHIRIEFISNRFREKPGRWVRLGTLVVALVYAIVASKASTEFVMASFQRDIRSQSWLRVPQGWPELALAIGFSLLALQLVVEVIKAVQAIRRGTSASTTGDSTQGWGWD